MLPWEIYPIASMYGIFTCIYHKNPPNIGRYTSPMDGMGMGIYRKIYLIAVEGFVS